MMTVYEVIELICDSLSDARSVIEDGGTWDPLVHVCHAGGAQSMVLPRSRSAPAHRTEVVDQINRLRKEFNGYSVMMFDDNWIPEENLGNSVTSSQEGSFPGRNEALVVTIWGSDGLPTYGTQRYRRNLDGHVLFDEFTWGVSLA